MDNRFLIIDIGHPANVHLFKYLYWELRTKGWGVLFTAIDKEVTIELLKVYDISYILIGKNHKGLIRKLAHLVVTVRNFYQAVNQHKPSIIISRGSIHASAVAKVKGINHIVLSDTESAGLLNRLTYPMIDVILTSDVFTKTLGKKQIRYPGYHELAYLHPRYFNPDPKVFNEMNIGEGEKFAIIRFVSWDAHHDIGHKGITRENKTKLVAELSKLLKVFVTSELEIPNSLQKYKLNLKPEKLHYALFFAHLTVSEGATIASESAILGTPSIYINDAQFGSTEDQASFGLLYPFTCSKSDQKKAIGKAIEIAQKNTIKHEYLLKRDNMMKLKINVTDFLVWFLENYPDSKTQVQTATFDFRKFMD